MYPVPHWPKELPIWDDESTNVISDGVTSEPRNLKLDELLQKSEEFPIKFPVDVVRCKTLKSSVETEILERNINSAYPVLHERALILYAKFILHKRKYGSTQETQIYKKITVLDFVERLLNKRAVMFMGKFDQYMLLDGTKGSGKWDVIGKSSETNKLNLKNCLSYDEIKLSVFLSVSSYTYFINDGKRKNNGVPAKSRTEVEPEGVIIGLIGARLKKPKVMEYEELVVTAVQNTKANGYGDTKIPTLHSIFAEFYEEPCFTHEDVLARKDGDTKRFTEVNSGEFFDNVYFSKRITLSIDTLLFEANGRAKEKNTTAFIHVVGIGLGVWKCSPHQEDVFIETFAKRIELQGTCLHAVSDVYFAYFGKGDSCGPYKHGNVIPIEGHPKKGIKVLKGKREPHEKLGGENEAKLLVVSYAWDGNSLPGNEFWSGKLASSGDSAAAVSTQISELHNPHINSRVCAANLKIATQQGIIPFSKYREKVKGVEEKRKRNSEAGEECTSLPKLQK